MDLTKVQTDAFSKIIKKGLEHYKVVPHAIGQIETENDHQIIGYVIWLDPEAGYITNEGYNQQEFYIKENGEICTMKNKVLVPLNFKSRTWKGLLGGE